MCLCGMFIPSIVETVVYTHTCICMYKHMHFFTYQCMTKNSTVTTVKPMLQLVWRSIAWRQVSEETNNTLCSSVGRPAVFDERGGTSLTHSTTYVHTCPFAESSSFCQCRWRSAHVSGYPMLLFARGRHAFGCPT